MIDNKKVVKKLYDEFFDDYLHERFVLDKTGVRVTERLNYSMELNPFDTDFEVYGRKAPEEYCQKERAWYLSQSLSIDPYMSDIKIWNQVCGKTTREINSNYGWCIFSDANYKQFDNAVSELFKNPSSRRALMIYNRPSMWKDYNRDGMSDFICTTATQLFIRNDRLYYVVNQRSCDLTTGFWNDFYWHSYVYKRALEELNAFVEDSVLPGTILYQCNSIHLYERNFKIFDIIAKSSLLNRVRYAIHNRKFNRKERTSV